MGLAYLFLLTIWFLVTALGRQIGTPSEYDRSQRLILALGSLALIPLVTVGPWEYTHFSGPIPRDGWSAWIGLALFISGIALQSAAMSALHGSYTIHLGIQKTQRLVTWGPYRLVRHPGYLSGVMAMLGIGLALSSLTVMMTTLLIVPLLLQRIRKEEEMLLREFPEYETYRQRTKRLLPLIW